MGQKKMSNNIQLVTQQEQKGVYVAQFKTKMLAVFTYYIESNKQAYLIDPTFDCMIFRDFVEKRGATLKYVVLTHYHADFLSGHTQLKVPIIMGQKSKRAINSFEVIEIKNNQKFKVGKVQTRVLATPGHTLESACFLLANQDGKQFCIFTGDTVFLREVGRPDLAVSSDISSKDLASMLYDSVQTIKALDNQLRLYPGHGNGSSCGKSIGAGNFCDLKTQAEANYAFLIATREQFVEKLTKDLPAPPKYFFHDAKINQQGSKVQYENVLSKVKRPLSVKQFQEILAKGVQLIDTRHIADNGLIEGAFWLSSNGQICALASNVAQPQKEIIIFIEKGKELQILERFIRIGYMNILGYNDFDMSNWKGKKIIPALKTYQNLDSNKKILHIDVRNKPELLQTGHFDGALCIPLPTLKSRIPQVLDRLRKQQYTDVVVNCKTGIRARLASAILMNNGVVNVTVLNEIIDKIGDKGVKLVPFVEK